MKHTVLILLLAGGSIHPSMAPTDCLISVEPKWENLCTDPTHIDTFGGKWIVVGSISFRKKIKDPTKLDKIRLAWHGPHMNNLSGSLYRKYPEKKFLAIEDNLICDSTWNRTKQELILNFEDNPQSLGPLTMFYLVLTVPPSQEEIIKQGHFSVLKACLPHSFREKATELKLDIAQFFSTNQASSTTS